MNNYEQRKYESIGRKWRQRVAEVEYDKDNDMGRWWVYLRDGWRCDTSAADHTIHEDTWQLAMACLRQSVPCSCDQCRGAAEQPAPLNPTLREDEDGVS